MSAPAPPRNDRRDAVGALLGQIWDDALDPGYAAAAARRSAKEQSTPERRRRAVGAAVALGLVGVLLAAAAVQTRMARPVVTEQRAQLVQRIHEQTRLNDQLSAAIASTGAEVDRLKSAQLATTVEGEQLASQLETLGVTSGALAVQGPGVRVSLDDAPAGSPLVDPTKPELSRVLDRDVAMVVNGLWAAGAEAISVNGQRLTSLSAIRTAGDAILVDYRPLTRPYVISAIGGPTLESQFAAGSAGASLRTLHDAYGIRYGIEGVQDLSLPAASGLTLRYATTEGAP
jgi:uncharacterized protein YlxW (UPF0749 family)